MTVYCEKQVEYIDTLCAHNAETLMVTHIMCLYSNERQCFIVKSSVGSHYNVVSRYSE